ncbi:MAG: ArnT family glycosyltransferase, partial [Planctomycetia bacterium]
MTISTLSEKPTPPPSTPELSVLAAKESEQPSEEPLSNGLVFLHLAMLFLASVLLRAPSLHVPPFNPDESQYLATVSFLKANDLSVFSNIYGPAWPMALYRTTADFCGPYPIAAVRFVVTLVTVLTAWMLYDVVRRVSSSTTGLGAALLFVYLNPVFEGFSANTEWLSAPYILAAVWLYCLDAGAARRPTRLFGLGLLAGFAFVFKGQASFLLGVVPGALLLETIAQRKIRAGLVGAAAFTIGATAAAAFGYAPFFAAGRGLESVGHIFNFVSSYVMQNNVAPRLEVAALSVFAPLIELKQNFFDKFQVLRGATAIGYAGAVCWLAVGGWRAFKGGGEWTLRDRTLLTLGLSLAASIACVRLGNRYFDHYYLYLVPFLAACVALAIDRLVRPPPP